MPRRAFDINISAQRRKNNKLEKKRKKGAAATRCSAPVKLFLERRFGLFVAGPRRAPNARPFSPLPSRGTFLGRRPDLFSVARTCRRPRNTWPGRSTRSGYKCRGAGEDPGLAGHPTPATVRKLCPPPPRAGD
jgi:hypothetical protein